MLLCKSKDNDGFAHGELTANTETDPLEISLHMQESAAKATSLEALNNALKTGQKNIVFDDDLTVNVADNDRTSAIRVDKEQGAADVVTLDGTGTVTSNGFGIWARAGAKVIVNGGNYVTTSTDDVHLVYANLGGYVEINGGTFSRDPSTQIAGNDKWDGLYGIKIEDGYKVVEKNIGGTIWYQVVPE